MVMFGLISVLLIVGAHAAVRHEESHVKAPPYVQSKASFLNTKLYLQENIPHDERNITNPDFRKHAAHGMIAAVTRKLVEAYIKNSTSYDPLKVLVEVVPVAWKDYNGEDSKPINVILAEALAGIQPVTILIEALCSATADVDECNAIVDAKVKEGTRFLKTRAELLLQLGVVSNVIRAHSDDIKKIAAQDHHIPYLIHNVNTAPYTAFVKELSKAYILLRKNLLQSES